MAVPRGPDVSPDFQWYPVVTFLQLTLDIAMATTSPMGYGHVFAAEHYIDAWMQVADIQGPVRAQGQGVVCWHSPNMQVFKRHSR